MRFIYKDTCIIVWYWTISFINLTSLKHYGIKSKDNVDCLGSPQVTLNSLMLMWIVWEVHKLLWDHCHFIVCNCSCNMYVLWAWCSDYWISKLLCRSWFIHLHINGDVASLIPLFEIQLQLVIGPSKIV